MQHNNSVPFDVAGSLVDLVLKEAALIDRLFLLLSQHVSADEMGSIANDIRDAATLLNSLVGEVDYDK